MSQSGQSEALLAGLGEMRNKNKIMEELKKRGSFEPNMDMTDMKNLLQAILESESAAGNANDQNMTENKTPEASPPSVLSYANKLSQNLPVSSGKRSANSEESAARPSDATSPEKQEDSSDEPIFSHSSAKPVRRKSGEAENSPAERNGRAGSAENATESTNANKRSSNKPNSQIRQDEKIAKFKINPLDFPAKQRDEPLVPHYRSYDNRARGEGGGGGGGGSFSNNERLLARFFNHLRQTAEICQKQRGGSVETNFQWGSAIKIGETNGNFDNGSCAEASKSSDFDEDASRPIASTSVTGETMTTRRRRLCAIKASIYDYGDDGNEKINNDENDDNSDEDFQMCAKRKKTIVPAPIVKRATNTRSGGKKSIELATTSRSIDDNSSHDKSSDHSTLFIDVSDECVITDDETPNEPPKKIPRGKSAEIESFVPRRIVPPKPGVKWAGIRARRPLLGPLSRIKKMRNEKSAEEDSSGAGQRGVKDGASLRDEEIAEALESIDDEDDENDGIAPLDPDSAVIRPLRISGRMKLQGQRLARLGETERNDETTRREMERNEEERIRREKIDRVQQRVREENERQKLLEESERQKARREIEWRAFVARSDKNKRPNERAELHPDGRPRDDEAGRDIRKNDASAHRSDDESASDNNDRGGETKSDRVQCPICYRGFTKDEIEAHAGICEEYDACTPGISRSSSPSLTPTKVVASQRSDPSPLLNCEVCANFSTYNGKAFENHTDTCLGRRRASMSNGQSLSQDSIIEVRTSPLRTVRTISELTDSEIDYKAQFLPKSKSNIGKKRKR